MKLAIYALFAWFILGTVYLTYMQHIDGHYVNKPITFTVDTQNLHVEKLRYAPGEEIRVFFSYCRHRNYTTRSTWKIINETVVTYPEKTAVLKPECVTNRPVAIGSVPQYAVKGEHHLEGVTQITINPLNVIYINYRSEPFTVI